MVPHRVVHMSLTNSKLYKQLFYFKKLYSVFGERKIHEAVESVPQIVDTARYFDDFYDTAVILTGHGRL